MTRPAQFAPHLDRDFVGYGANPPDAAWPNGARIAVNICLNIEEGGEPSVSDGDEFTEGGLTFSRPGKSYLRDLGAESMFEYGSRVGFWRIHRLLQERALPATMYVCGLALERNAEVAAAIGAADYDLCGHGWRWEYPMDLTEDEERDRIARTIAAAERTVGRRPEGWYCRYAPSHHTRRLLVEEGGFLYDSDSYADDLPYWTTVGGAPHLIVPYSLMANDVLAMRSGLATADLYFAFLRDAFDTLYREGTHTPRMLSVGLHGRIIGHPGRFPGLERFLDHLAALPDVWVCRRADIARHWSQKHPYPGEP
ncbi:polysaccharide deacetylase family protein [Acuticoccus mangrovi]|uniref:Chitooligosaccharide deacetylase n=1 Tax=Acuticoccus mangrovi TaxID=2796142 RepID=A0A934IPZ8_9HYPH|nr:polysaccharide deacetylase family protein [Acuticoccus mangrovi]MBJ3776182.1 polysaccharide deacetylase family protein [Acuticoccus mangrovi]